MRVDIWSDVVCPWCYLGKKNFEDALKSFDDRGDVDVVYRSFELDPTAERDVTTPTVELLAAKYGMSVTEANAAQQQMTERAAQAGLEFRMAGLRSGNTRDAHRLLHLASAHGRQPELMEALHRAYFTEQRSIFDSASLTELAVESGLDRDEAREVLQSQEYDEAVEADESTASSLGVTGVPFFVIDRKFAVSGAQPAEILVRALEHARAEAVQPA
jgi:predicted DsbA family dithiol-disulfide isomerase